MTEREFLEKMLELSKVSKVLSVTDNSCLQIGKLISIIIGIPIEVEHYHWGTVVTTPRAEEARPVLKSLNLWSIEDYDQKEEAIDELKPDYVFDERDFSILRLKPEK